MGVMNMHEKMHILLHIMKNDAFSKVILEKPKVLEASFFCLKQMPLTFIFFIDKLVINSLQINV